LKSQFFAQAGGETAGNNPKLADVFLRAPRIGSARKTLVQKDFIGASMIPKQLASVAPPGLARTILSGMVGIRIYNLCTVGCLLN